MKKCLACGISLVGKKRKNKKYCSIICRSSDVVGKPLSEERKEKLRGRKLSFETIQKQNLAKSKERFRVEGNFVCKKCKKVFTSNTSVRAHMSYCTPQSTGQIEQKTCETCNKQFKSERSVKIHQKLTHNMTEERTLSRKNKMITAKSKNTFRKESIAEMVFFDKVKKIFEDSERSFKFKEQLHVYDIVIPSTQTIIEFDGDYWHGNPKYHILTDRMKQQYRIDISNTKFACKMGYKCVRVWQSESQKFLDCLEKEKECLLLEQQK